jgi:hypothetical protein
MGWGGQQSEIPLVLLSVILFSNALIMFYLYILGAYLGRAYMEVKGRPPFVISEILSSVVMQAPAAQAGSNQVVSIPIPSTEIELQN